MPVKVRRPKRRVSDAAELEAWSTFFEFGKDFFHQLDDWGLDTDKARHAAAPAAWRRFGETFMATWRPTVIRNEPWAFEQFGSPKGGRKRCQ